nr:uncharacterized mitochondrial protein AtMg00810-like [Tanacetum cinerariifolium]
IKVSDNVGQAIKDIEVIKDYILLPLWTTVPLFYQDPVSSHDDGSKPSCDDGKKIKEDQRKESRCKDQKKEDNVNNTNNVNTADVSIFNFLGCNEDDDTVADINNLDTTIQVSPIPTTRIHKDHPLDQVIGNLQSTTQTRKMSKNLEEHGFVRFEDPDFPDRVYKVEKALYGLHQAPRACFIKVKTTSTSMETQKPLIKDKDGKEVDVHMYRSMIGSLMYLTSSRPDIMFAVCACARYQVNLKVSHLYAVKWIFRYLKGQPKLGLCYPKDSPFPLVAYTNSDYAEASLDRKSTTRDGKEIVIIESSVRRDLQLADEKGSTMLTDPYHTPIILQPSSSQSQKTQKPKKHIRKDTHVPQPSGPTESIAYEAVHKELGDNLVRAATTASSLGVEQDNGDTNAQTRFKSVSKHSNDSLLTRGNTLQNDEDSMKLDELMALCTTLKNRVLDL